MNISELKKHLAEPTKKELINEISTASLAL